MNAMFRFLLSFVIFAASAECFAAHGGRGKSAADAQALEKREEWIRSVKKLQAEPVADGFVKWTGLDTVKGTKNGRWLTPSDLRGRFAIIVELDEAKVPAQLRETFNLHKLGPVGSMFSSWDFSSPKRDVVVVYNVHNFSDDDLEKKVYDDEKFKDAQRMGFTFYGNVTFEGAPDSASNRPYVYVMPPEGKEPIFSGKFDEKTTASKIRAAISKANKSLGAWRTWYGYVAEVKHVKGFDAAVESGKALSSMAMTLKKGILGKNPEASAEAQRLYDALQQRKGDLIYYIRAENFGYPFAATYDLEELSRRFPAEKREFAAVTERIAKRYPNLGKLYRQYSLIRQCSAKDFHVKSASEAKKLSAELEKTRPVLKKFSEDTKDMSMQNMASALLSKLDDVIAELPNKVVEK